MKGKTRCPYCNRNVVVEVAEGTEGIQKTTCPNCNMSIKVDVTTEEPPAESPIHPLVEHHPSRKLFVAGVLLMVACLLGLAMGTSYFLAEDKLLSGNGTYEGTVVDENGNAIAHAVISLADEEPPRVVTHTDEQGLFSLNITAGIHTITIAYDNYTTKRVTIGVFPFETMITEQFVLKKNGEENTEKAMSARIFELLPLIFSMFVVLSIPPLVGAICCIMKKYMVVAVIGAVCGILSMGFLVGSLLSIVALILIIIARDEFTR
ncbi:MAG: hypothetical protein DRN07_07425 [Thermoplasmata archaeon]|nr:MAG: hypothetical protein DRN07_07425 [Thermoplasmata archaeon]